MKEPIDYSLFCDHCGELIQGDEKAVWIDELQWPVASANIGESACLCTSCKDMFTSSR